MKTLFLHQILEVTLRLSIEDNKVCEISKLTLGLFRDILTLHPHNSKSSLPTTGTFRYVESHMDAGTSLTTITSQCLNVWTILSHFSQ